MLRAIKLATVLSVSSFALLAAPFVAGAGTLGLSGFAAYAEKGGNGGGNGGGDGNGGGGGGGDGNGGGGGGESHGKSGQTHGNSANAVNDESEETVAVAKGKGHVTELSERNLQSQLAGLNSLKRNVSGLMNSSDPRMEGIREFIEAGATLEGALDALAEAEVAFGDATEAYLGLVNDLLPTPYDGDLEGYGDLSIADLEARLSNLESRALTEADADYDAWLAEMESLDAAISTLEASEELAALNAAKEALEDTTEAVETAEGETDDESLKEALLLAANDNRVAEYGDEYITDEILGWAKGVLGVGDADGAIDDYVDQQ
ncbi:MAG: hypothetical protein ACYCZU_12120 [Devosia sp.]